MPSEILSYLLSTITFFIMMLASFHFIYSSIRHPLKISAVKFVASILYFSYVKRMRRNNFSKSISASLSEDKLLNLKGSSDNF